MTTTRSSEHTTKPSLDRQFDSDSRSLVLDNDASGCITNMKGNFIELPKHVDRKVKGIKGHAKATHRGTIKWHVEDDNGLVHIMVIKHAFESSAYQCGVKVLHYHANNGQFTDNAFIADCKVQRQGLSYCGVNAHFQNGIAERRIMDHQEQTRTSMLSAMYKWTRMILICSWHYTMRHVNDVANSTPRKGEDQSHLEKFSGVNAKPKLRHFHDFGCPTYVLDNTLQSGQVAPKWKHCSRLGVYLGPSPSHAQSVALVLNPRTGQG